jgi:hypothetical protein
MWPFGEQKTATILEPAPVDREAEALSRVRLLKAQLNEIDREMLEFKTKHAVKTDRFSRLLSVHSPGMTHYAAIRTEWDALLRRRDKTVAQWHAALHSWSEAKGAAK